MNFNIFTIDRGQARALACTVHIYIFDGKNKRCENQRLLAITYYVYLHNKIVDHRFHQWRHIRARAYESFVNKSHLKAFSLRDSYSLDFFFQDIWVARAVLKVRTRATSSKYV